MDDVLDLCDLERGRFSFAIFGAFRHSIFAGLSLVSCQKKVVRGWIYMRFFWIIPILLEF